MRRIKTLAIAVIAVCALTAAAAVAHEFSATTMGALSVTSNATQKFTTDSGNVECPTIKIHAVVPEPLKALFIHATVLYSGCKGFGTAVTVSTALYDFLADNLVVHILNPISISGTGCKMTVKAQSVSKVLFINKGTELELKPEVKGISYEGSGALCASTNTNGTYEGASVVGVAGGTIEWK